VALVEILFLVLLHPLVAVVHILTLEVVLHLRLVVQELAELGQMYLLVVELQDKVMQVVLVLRLLPLTAQEVVVEQAV
jgi:hypothetical protein